MGWEVFVGIGGLRIVTWVEVGRERLVTARGTVLEVLRPRSRDTVMAVLVVGRNCERGNQLRRWVGGWGVGRP